jgi:hypothetical protein
MAGPGGRPSAAIPIEAVDITLPSDPILLNRSPFVPELHPDRLRLAIGLLDERAPRHELAELTAIDLDWSDPLHPVMLGEEDKPAPPAFDYETGELSVRVPSEQSKRGTPTDALVQYAEVAINRGILRGFTELMYLRRELGNERIQYIGAPVLLALVGDTISMAGGADSVSAAATKGAGGAAAGAAVGIVAYGGKRAYERVRYGARPAPQAHRAVETAQEKLAEPVVREPFFPEDERIVTLRAA